MLFETTSQIEVKGNYKKYFDQLLEIVKNNDINGDKIKEFAIRFAKEINTDEFTNFSDSGYGRNYIGKDENGWEVLVMTWKKGNRTVIHGHPLYAGYTVIKGEILLEIFEKAEGGLKKVLEYKARKNSSFYALSEVNDFENHIHRITGLTDKALTLHIYSDDARKGKIYDDWKIIE